MSMRRFYKCYYISFILVLYARGFEIYDNMSVKLFNFFVLCEFQIIYFFVFDVDL